MLQQQHPTLPTFKLVDLDQLVLSSENVATTGRDQVDDLVASIAAHGLQQNLVVSKAAGSDTYLVKAGGRRLRALKVLAETGEWPADRQVPVSVLAPGASAREISIAENLIRRDMHPADECEAFARLVRDDGYSVADLAAHFGVSERYVRSRLSLSDVSPKLIEEFRAGNLSLAQMQALAVSTHHGDQEAAWARASKAGTWAQEPGRLRAELTNKELEVGKSAVATFLGLEDYLAGGGLPREDLFGGEGAGFLPDVQLARRLCKEKLDRLAKQYDGEGWAWKEVRLELGWQDLEKFAKYGQKDRYDHVDTKKTKWPAAAKEVAGILVALDRDGKPEIHRGLIRPEDQKRLVAAATKAAEKAAGGAASLSASPTKPVKDSTELSFPQQQVLQAELTAVVRNEIAGDQRVALAALAARLASELGIVSGTELDNLVRVGKEHTSEGRVPVNVRDVLEKAPASRALQAKVKAWKDRVPKRIPTLTWLLEQPEAVTHELLALCAAQALIAIDHAPGRRDTAATFATAAGVDLSNHWAPTAEWLSKQPTAYIVRAVTEARGKEAAARLQKEAKGKAAIAKRAAELLAPTPGGKAPWLPKPLRAPAKPAREKRAAPKGKAAAAGDIE